MRIKRFFERVRRDHDFAEELACYLAHEIEDNMALGMSAGEARDAALRKLGNRTILQEEIHHMNSLGFIESVWQDLRYAARTLRTNPGFTIVAVLSLALGIGANAALFQLIDAVMLRSLPVKAPEQLVRIGLPPQASRSGNFWDQPNELTRPQWEFLRSNHAPFQDVFAWGRSHFNLSESGQIRYAPGIFVSGEFFRTLGVPALIGRTIEPADDHTGCGTSAAVLSYGFWQREYGASRSVLSRTVSLDGHRFPIVGVTPPEFTGIDAGEPFTVAIPICSQQAMSEQGRNDDKAFWWLGAFGRLKPGGSLKEANAFLQAISPELYRSTVSPRYRPDTAKKYLKLQLQATPGGTGFSNLRVSVGTPLLLLLSLAGLVLIIACANLANLLLARANIREHEIAVRLAVGASRWRIVQHLLSESLLLAAGGALAGALLALALSRYLVRSFSTTDQVYSLDLSLDGHFVGFLAAIALFTCVLFGLAPALRGSRRQPGTTLKQASRSTPSRERFSLQRILVVAQISLSLTLLVGSLLFVRSFQKLMTLDPGFRSNGLLSASIDFRPDVVPQASRAAMYDDIVTRLRTIPGVDFAAAVGQAPMSGGYSNNTIHIDGDKVDERVADFNWPGDGYFQTMGIPLLGGRDFTPHDDNSSAPVVVVDTTFAQKLLGGANPVGKTLYVKPEPGKPVKRLTIVGLVGHSKYQDLQSAFEPIVYQPFRQLDEQFAGMWFVVHSNAPLASTIKAVNQAILSVNPQLSTYLQGFPSKIDDSVRREDVMAKLSSFFGILALILATVGLYGLMSYMVTHRRNEIGIRLAIGASPKSILVMIVKQSAILLAAGLVVGSTLALIFSKSAQSLLFEVRANDPFMILAAALALGAITVAATLVPARRAASLDPMQTLRNE